MGWGGLEWGGVGWGGVEWCRLVSFGGGGVLCGVLCCVVVWYGVVWCGVGWGGVGWGGVVRCKMRGIQDSLNALICVSRTVRFKPPLLTEFINECLVTLSGSFHKIQSFFLFLYKFYRSFYYRRNI